MASAITFRAAMFCALTSTTIAHMLIRSPVPYGQSSLTNAPLSDDGSDYPCKQRPGVYDITSMNTMAVGEPQTLSFMGSAVHGGGSCQLSVTLDTEPTAKSQFKVIKSIIGGCPSNVTGNLDADPNGSGAATFEYEIPEGMPNGQYTLAWTWFNKIGNREMYMNCAPITVTGGADNNDYYNSLPDMFVINLPQESCSNVEGEDFNFPSPGPSATTVFSTALGTSTLGTGCASVMAKGAGAGTAGSAAAATGTMAPSSDTPSAPTSAVPSSNLPLVTVTTLATVTANGPNTPPSSPPPASATPSSPAGGTAGSGSCPAGQISCPTPGALICISSTQFGLCNFGCAIPQPVAAGTTCENGTVVKRDGDGENEGASASQSERRSGKARRQRRYRHVHGHAHAGPRFS